MTDKLVYNIFLEFTDGKLRVEEKFADNSAEIISKLLTDAIHFRDIDKIHAFEVEFPDNEFQFYKSN